MALGVDISRASEEALQRIVGGRLTSVQFILNYLTLGFDERGALTTLVWPSIHDQRTVHSFGEWGYRDKLCSLIECVVQNATMEEHETINICFQSSVKLKIPLEEYKGKGERAILTGWKHFIFVF